MNPTERPGGDIVDDLRIDLLHGAEDTRAAADLWRDVWGGEQYPVQAAMALAQAHVGSYVSGAWDGDRLVAASLGLLGPAEARVLHSHITGVRPDVVGRGIGLALKRHQASWCRAHGIATVTWTFDPLVARNAWFNLGRLGAEVVGYHVDLYGDMPDERNRGQGSDRLLVAWDVRDDDPLDADAVATTAHGPAHAVVAVGPDHEPVVTPGDHDVVEVAVPRDVEEMRRHDPALAIRWRHAVRAAMAPRLVADPDGGPPAWTVARVTREGTYLLRRPA